jgi:2',3'-cyclic-nucleotide 2'-phosphodiesterase
MKILMAGDCVGRAGRKIVTEKLASLRQAHALDLIVLNVENAAAGFSITLSTAQELFAAGVDVMTSGNHIFDKKEALELIKAEPRLLRPVNYVPTLPGSGVWTGEINGVPVAVINVQGRVFMPPCDDPFRAMDAALAALDPKYKLIFVDMHAETTAEKIAMGRYLDGRVSALVGTHTHVPTADEQILPGGTAYLTDLGMTGPHDGVIGMKTASVLDRFLTGLNSRFEVSEGELQLNGLLIEVNDETGRAERVERLRVKLD